MVLGGIVELLIGIKAEGQVARGRHKADHVQLLRKAGPAPAPAG